LSPIKILEVIAQFNKRIGSIIVFYSDIWYNKSTVGKMSVHAI